MSDHPNAQVIRDLFAAFRTGDVDRICAIIPDDAVWHFPGRDGQLAGAHRGRDGIMAFLMKVMSLTAGTFHLELEDVIANDANAVALFRGSGQREGRKLDNPTCLRMKLRHGQVVELQEFVWDLFAVDLFWK